MFPGAALLAAVVLTAPPADPNAPSQQALVFYNARIALREGRSADVLKLWLIRNSLHDRSVLSPQDDEFRSVVWAAAGRLGICQDGFARDERGGAGLWPLAAHNWLIDALHRGNAPSRPAPFDAFEVGRQQRAISLHDVLSATELRSVGFHRGFCVAPYLSMLEYGEWPFIDIKDRLSSGVLLRHFLKASKQTLVPEKVKNAAVIDARLFDLELALTALQERAARREGTVASRRAKELGMTDIGAAEAKAAAATWPKNSAQAKFLKKSLTWTADDWLSLNSQRRLFLFNQARRFSEDPVALERLELEIIDGLIDSRSGAELESWFGFLEARDKPERRAPIFLGDRGKRLLALERDTGFRERATIALHRGVAFLEAGDRMESLRAFAYAMQQSDDSREAAVILPLARRWISNVLARYETSPEVVETLRVLVPRREYNAVIEDLVWSAALRADRRSFELVTRSYERGGGFEAKVLRLRPLSEGKAGPFLTELRDGLETEPYLTLRFVRQLIEQLETEESDVRRANIPLMERLSELLLALASAKGGPDAHRRNGEELHNRTQAILTGLDELDHSLQGQARSLSPSQQTFAGSIRLAPSDPLPWPFLVPETAPPSAFTPLLLEPIEWRDAKGTLVFGWRISE